MCDFHSTCWRLIGPDAECAHLPTNSHSESITAAGWRENQPNRKTIVFEVEWDLRGDMPADSKLIRNHGDCPEQLVTAIKRHYLAAKKFIETGEGWKKFGDLEKWGDLWSKVRVLPEGVTFPKECGSLYLRSDLKAQLEKRKAKK